MSPPPGSLGSLPLLPPPDEVAQPAPRPYPPEASATPLPLLPPPTPEASPRPNGPRTPDGALREGEAAQFQTCVTADGSVDRILDAVAI